MTNLSADVMRPYKGDVEYQQYGLVGYTDYQSGTTAYTVYKGSPVCIDVDDIDGYAQPFLSGITAAGGDVFLGIAEEQVSVTASDTAQGDKKIKVAISGIWGFPAGSITVTDIGAPAYADDSAVVTTTSANNLWIGTIVNVDATYVWVNIAHAAGRANSAT